MTAGVVLAEQRIALRTEIRFRGARRIVPAVLLFAALLSQLCIRVEIIRAGYRLEEIRSATIQNDARLRELRYRYAEATSPTVILEQAKRRLGVEPTAPQQIRRITGR